MYSKQMKNTSSTIISGPLQTERMCNGRRKLLRELQLQINEDIYTIEKGFNTDYSSIPWFGRFVVRWSKVDVAGVVHDWLYFYGKETRSKSDQIWRIIAVSGDHSANPLQAWICWFSLRVGGFPAWKGYRDKEAAKEPQS